MIGDYKLVIGFEKDNVFYGFNAFCDITNELTLNSCSKLAKEDLISIILQRQIQYNQITKYFRWENGKLIFKGVEN